MALRDVVAFTVEYMDREHSGSWAAPAVTIAELNKSMSNDLPRAHPVHTARKSHRNLAELYKSNREAIAPLLILDGSVIRMKMPIPDFHDVSHLLTMAEHASLVSFVERIDEAKRRHERQPKLRSIAAARKRGPKVWSSPHHIEYGQAFQRVMVTSVLVLRRKCAKLNQDALLHVLSFL